MFHKGLFILAHQCGDTSFYQTYQKLVKNQWKSRDELKQNQEKQLRHLMYFVYENVPYYHNLLKGLGILPGDIQTLEDLQKLPILTKDIIKEHREELKPINLLSMKYRNQATGGSTGTPMEYRLSKRDRFLGGALLYRGWGYGGFELGDKMILMAGSSLDVGTKPYLVKKVQETARNVRKLSSFDMGETEMREYAETLNSFKPRFIRGYASSIYFFARWLEATQVSVPSPEAVFTTSEKLFPHMRKTIGDVFDCSVYDAYGLNDGGISAYECSEHAGLHVDTERSVMEVVDEDNVAVEEGEGHILATSLHNYAMPFIRYATADEGFLLDDSCPCGRGYSLLKEILGRQQEMLITPEGKHIHGEYITHIFWEVPHVKEFQVVQKRVDQLTFNIVREDGFDEKSLDYIRSVIRTRSKKWDIQFRFVDTIDRSRAGKYRFVINEVVQ